MTTPRKTSGGAPATAPRFTAAQRMQALAAGRKHAEAVAKAKSALDRATAAPRKRYDEAVAKAEAEYDAALASITTRLEA